MDQHESFTIDNLPYGVFSTFQNRQKRCAIAYGQHAYDVAVLQAQGCFSLVEELHADIFTAGNWNAFATLPSASRGIFRDALRKAILDGTADPARIPFTAIQLHLPMDVHNFSDFYCSLEHTRNCSNLMNLDIKKNWYAMPSVYNGRTTSLVVSGTSFHRPYGMVQDLQNQSSAVFKPEPFLDYELEMGVWLSKSIPRGSRASVDEAYDHIFGLTLLNDWSARAIQGFEMPPLGPFHAKGSATTISPWIVPIEALQKARCAREITQQPIPPPHLTPSLLDVETFDVELTLKLLRDGQVYTLCETNLKELHWSPPQMLAHLGSAGEGLWTGDVFGTGTISSNRRSPSGERTGLACLFERKLPDAKLSGAPADLVDNFLKDGDEILIEGAAVDKATGKKYLGFGECRGRILPPK